MNIDARLTLPPRLELNKRQGSSSKAPLAKVSFTALLQGQDRLS